MTMKSYVYASAATGDTGTWAPTSCGLSSGTPVIGETDDVCTNTMKLEGW